MARMFLGTLDDIAGVENLLEAWKEFLPHKRGKPDVQDFSLRLMDAILLLHRDVVSGQYRHGSYKQFSISDPKQRLISKASVRDRLLHHAIHRVLYPFFDRAFIADSFSCRNEKGTHRALARFQSFFQKVSRNNTRACWVLKCDIRKFFASIDHATLKNILRRSIADQAVLMLLSRIIDSFPGGLPLGNLTSQLLVNVYMNEFDQFVKHSLKVKYYIRYADDFVFLSRDRDWLLELLPRVGDFLKEQLQLDLHPQKVFIKPYTSGIDFLGWVHFADHRVLRSASRRRMFRRLSVSSNPAVVQSYLGLLSHGNAYKLSRALDSP